MSLRFQTAFQVENLPDEQIDSAFEVVMPTLDITPTNDDNEETDSNKGITSSFFGSIGSRFTGAFCGNYTPIVESIVFTPPKIKTENRRIRMGWINFPVDIENVQAAKITMFCSQNMLTQYYLDRWNKLIYNPVGEYFNSVGVFKKNIEIYIYGGALSSAATGISSLISGGDSHTSVAHFTLSGAFPISQGEYKLQYSDDPKRLTITADFAYDKLIPDLSTAAASITAELISTGGIGILDNINDVYGVGNYQSSTASSGLLNKATDAVTKLIK